MSTCEGKIAWARAKRDSALAKVEPQLQGIPTQLPLSSQGLAKDVLTPREIEITENYSVTELLYILKERKISVEEVTRAFLRRAALAQAAVSLPYLLEFCGCCILMTDDGRQIAWQTYYGTKPSLEPNIWILSQSPRACYSVCPFPPKSTTEWWDPTSRPMPHLSPGLVNLTGLTCSMTLYGMRDVCFMSARRSPSGLCSSKPTALYMAGRSIRITEISPQVEAVVESRHCLG